MRSSVAVGLLLTSSMSIFGIYARQAMNPAVPAGPEPVWVNGKMGVYSPETGEFVPSDSPTFDQTCDQIQAARNPASATNPTTAPTTAPSNYDSSYTGSSNDGSTYDGSSNSGSSYYGSSYGGSTYYHGIHPSYSYYYGGSSASRSPDSDYGGSSAARSNSARGGFGATGDAMGGAHA
jgi:hypothetical protein